MQPEPQRLHLAQLPTPIQSMPRLSNEWGIDLRVKRDDLSGVELTGNKIRKLEFLLHDALEQGCDTLITCGAVNSNHARATALAARRLGLECHLILAGDPPDSPTGNLLLDLLVDAHIHYISRMEYTTRIEEHLHRHASLLRDQNKKPYIIPTGGSNAMGMWGYIHAIREIQEQCRAASWYPDYVVCAVGSGGTYAGLLSGNRIYALNAVCLGVLVSGSIPYFQEKISEDIVQWRDRFSQSISLSTDEMRMVQDYIAGGYARTNSEQLRFLRHTAQREGLIFDPVYTNKALFGLYHEVKKGSVAAGSKVLFIHTGGLFGLFNYSATMMDEWQSVAHWADR